MKYIFAILVLFAGSECALAEDVAQVCPVVMSLEDLHNAGGQLRLKSHGSVVCPVCVAKGTCGDGHVVLQSTIQTDGSQAGMAVMEDTYDPNAREETTSAALEEAKQMTYEPPVVNGKPVCVKRLIMFHWVRN